MGNFIKTYSGKYIDVFEPEPEAIDIIDIAHVLGMMPRFGGHTREFYSVAQHSIAVAHYTGLSKSEWALEGLMHDAAEAYVMDMPSPIKHRLPEYIAMENKLLEAIFRRFNLKWPMDPIIKAADKLALNIEMQDLQDMNVMRIMDSKQAANRFLNMFGYYTELRKVYELPAA